MRWLIGISLRFRTIVVALACAVMLLGSLQLGSASVDVFPEFAPPRVEIQTACLGLTAEEVEQLVSVPIEASVGGMPGLDEVRAAVGAALGNPARPARVLTGAAIPLLPSGKPDRQALAARAAQ